MSYYSSYPHERLKTLVASPSEARQLVKDGYKKYPVWWWVQYKGQALELKRLDDFKFKSAEWVLPAPIVRSEI